MSEEPEEEEERPEKPSKRRAAPREEPPEPEPAFDLGEVFKGEGEMDPMIRYMMWQDWREEKREKQREREQPQRQPELTLDFIREAVAAAIEKILPSRPETDEMPPWAKQMQENQKAIMAQLSKNEQEKHDQDLIERATSPLITELDKERVERQRIEGELKEVSRKLETPPAPQKTAFEAAKEAVEFTDKVRPPPKTERKGKATDTDVALTTVERATEVVRDVGKGFQETVGDFIDWQVERERRLYKGIAPNLKELSSQERVDSLKEALGEKKEEGTK